MAIFHKLHVLLRGYTAVLSSPVGWLVWQVPEQFLSFSLINEDWVFSAHMASEEV